MAKRLKKMERVLGSIMYINHYTLNSAHNHRSYRDNVSDDSIKLLASWIDDNINGDFAALPVPDLRHYSAKILNVDGSLVITVMGALGPHVQGQAANAKVPLVAFGVAHRSRHSNQLWRALTEHTDKQLHASDIAEPKTPWLAALVYPSAMMHGESLAWLADFERCCAWAWITRNPNLQSV